MAALATCASPAHASTDPSHTCILFEDDSFICGTADPIGGWVDRSLPYVTGCIPQGVCDSDTRE